MKTAIELFHELPEGIRDKAIQNAVKQTGKDVLSDEYESVAEALLNTFTWCYTPEGQGHNFWEQIYLQNGGKL